MSIVSWLSQLEQEASTGFSSLEIEKKRLKLEVGSQSLVTLSEDIDRTSL